MFKIVANSGFFQPIKIDNFTWLNIDSPIPNTEKKIKNKTNLYFYKSAFNNLSEDIGYGYNKEQNQVEQGGILIGKVFQKKGTSLICGLVEYVIPSLLAKGSMTYFEMNYDSWQAMLNELDELNLEIPIQEQVSIIGWYHTHPKHLRIYMSEKDLKTQNLFFQLDYHFSVILNPQQKKWSVFQGKLGNECKGYIIQ